MHSTGRRDEQGAMHSTGAHWQQLAHCGTPGSRSPDCKCLCAPLRPESSPPDLVADTRGRYPWPIPMTCALLALPAAMWHAQPLMHERTASTAFHTAWGTVRSRTNPGLGGMHLGLRCPCLPLLPSAERKAGRQRQARQQSFHSFLPTRMCTPQMWHVNGYAFGKFQF